jgi:hypothetical protein
MDIDQILDDWLGEGPTQIPDRVIASITADIERAAPKRRWRLPWRNHMYRNYVAFAGAAVVAVIAVGVALSLLANRPGIAGTSPSPQPSPASGFSRFTSPTQRISIDYPSSWQVRPATEPWRLDPVGFAATDIDVIFDPAHEGDLYIGLASGRASESLVGPSHDGWPDIQQAAQVCGGEGTNWGSGAGRYPVDGAQSWAGYCHYDTASPTNWFAFVGTATRGYVIYLHAADPSLSAYYGEDRFDALLDTVDLLP